MTDQELQSLRNLGNECEAAADEIVRVLMLALEDGGIEVLDVQEFKIKARPPIPECVVLAAPKAEPLTYGPQRKGRGGKVRRW